MAIDSINLKPPTIRTELLSEAYDILQYLYENKQMIDSANVYYFANKEIQASAIDEIDRIKTLQFDFTNGENLAIIDQKNYEIKSAEAYLNNLQNYTFQIQDSLYTIKDSLPIMRNAIQKLKGDLMVLDDTKMRLEKDTVFLAKRIDQQNNNIRKKNFYGGLLIAGLVGLVIITSVIYQTRLTAKNKRLVNTRSKLNALAKNKFHNVRNKYGKFVNMIDDNNISKACEYAKLSSNYLSYALDYVDWESDMWTVDNEIELVKKSEAAQKVITPNIEIIWDFPKVNWQKIRFIPDILTTVYENSVLHGFKYLNSDEHGIVTIRCFMVGEMLNFEMSDNGMAAPRLSSYLIPGKPNKGINLIRSRVETEIKMNKRTRKLNPTFFAGPIKEMKGSIVKFSFPYEISTKDSNS